MFIFVIKSLSELHPRKTWINKKIKKKDQSEEAALEWFEIVSKWVIENGISGKAGVVGVDDLGLPVIINLLFCNDSYNSYFDTPDSDFILFLFLLHLPSSFAHPPVASCKFSHPILLIKLFLKLSCK